VRISCSDTWVPDRVAPGRGAATLSTGAVASSRAPFSTSSVRELSSCGFLRRIREGLAIQWNFTFDKCLCEGKIRWD
jgi:hypothetical protein